MTHHRSTTPIQLPLPLAPAPLLTEPEYRSIVTALAQTLLTAAKSIGQLRAARSDPDLQVDIVTHSAGGLIARYFVRYGGVDVLGKAIPKPPASGAASLHKAVLIAPLSLGSIYGLQRAMRGVNVGLSQVGPEIMATMPSIYQLLPHPDRQWMIDLEGNPVAVDLYDLENMAQIPLRGLVARVRVWLSFPLPVDLVK